MRKINMLTFFLFLYAVSTTLVIYDLMRVKVMGDELPHGIEESESDFKENNYTPSRREADRVEIQKQIDAYLEKGGKIQHLRFVPPKQQELDFMPLDLDSTELDEVRGYNEEF
jgi:hypothetical protein